jgi:ABC-type dipeptide/oligopeptide/nickel transport system ATPase component
MKQMTALANHVVEQIGEIQHAEEVKSTLVVALIGESGAGKNALAEALVALVPETYTQCRQVTTRDRRPEEGDTYDFIDVETYRQLEDGLIGKTVINKNGTDTFYGTKFSNDPSKVHLVIVNEMGLQQLKDSLYSNPAYNNVAIMVVAITRNGTNDDPSTYVQREDRDLEYVKKEVEFVIGYRRDQNPRELNSILIRNSHAVPIEEYANFTTYQIVTQASLAQQNAADEEDGYVNTDAINDR